MIIDLLLMSSVILKLKRVDKKYTITTHVSVLMNVCSFSLSRYLCVYIDICINRVEKKRRWVRLIIV